MKLDVTKSKRMADQEEFIDHDFMLTSARLRKSCFKIQQGNFEIFLTVLRTVEIHQIHKNIS